MLSHITALKELLETSRKNDTYHFEVTKKDRTFVLSVSASEPIAILNQQTTDALLSIFEIKSVEFRAHALASTCGVARETRKTKTSDVHITLDINVYGDKSVQNAVGEPLSDAKQFLQHPTFIESQTSYENPHFVSIPGIQPKPVSLFKSMEEVPDSGANSVVHEFEQSSFKNELALVFTSLTRARCLKVLDANTRIKTKLLQ